MTLIGVAIARSTCVNLSFNKLMNKTKKNSINSNLKGQSFHNILNVDTLKAIALTIAIYVICFLIGDSYLKSLLYERGFTQYIVVKADSYEAFRAAREVAWKQGFDVGWEPQTVDTELAFNVLGSGGRAVNIQ